MQILRLLTASAAALLVAGVLSPAAFAAKAKKAKSYLMYVGTYTDKGSSSKGIYAFRFNPSDGELKPLGLEAETTSPSFLATDPRGLYLYAVNEVNTFDGQKSGSVSAFTLDDTTGALKPLNTVASGGSGPCHLMVDATTKMLVVANYGSGSAAAFPIGPDGRLGNRSAFDQHTGSSVDKQRQGGPHAHCAMISPDNKFVMVADLGLDKVFVYKLDPSTGALIPNTPPTASVAAGAGPRHFAFHPNSKYAYVINEMGSTVTAFRYAKTGSLTEIQTVSTLPADFKGESTTAEVFVHPNGKFLYGSNRGHDSIAVFSIDSGTGKLTPVEHVSVQGKTPRNFAIDPTGKFLFAANQDSNNIVAFSIDPKTGKLTPTGKTYAVDKPVSLIFVASK